MESFGNLLRTKREEKNIPLETASRDTIISKQYLEALENEYIDIFPGHTYVTGFLRNYSEYLGLDSTYIVKLFKSKIMQEAPVPESLIIQKRISKKLIAAIAGGAVGLCAAVILTLYFTVIKPGKEKTPAVDLGKDKGQSYTISAIPLQRRLYKGDTICVPFPENTVNLGVEKTLNTLALNTPLGVQYIELGEELEMDVDGSGSADIVVFLSDISKENEDLGAEVRMFVKAGSTAAMSSNELASAETVAVDSGEVLKDGTKYTVVLQDNRAYPFTINASFRGMCLYRYKSDRSDPSEHLLTSGDTLKVSAQSALRLWISNANTVKMQLVAEGKSYDLEMGRPGQVLVEDVRWIKEADGVYKLTVAEVD